MSAAARNPAVDAMIAAIVIALKEENPTTLPPRVAALLDGLRIVEGASVPAAAAAAAAPTPAGKDFQLHKHKGSVTPEHSRRDVTPRVSREDWQKWASAVSAYITAVAERFPEGVPMPNLNNRVLYENAQIEFVAFPGVKGGLEQALLKNRFEISENEETGCKLVKNPTA